MDLKAIGKNIKKYRTENGLSQEGLAELVQVSTNYIGMIERCIKTPSLETFLVIADKLSVTADQLLVDSNYSGYKVKDSMLAEKLEKLSPEDRQRIYDVIEAMTKHLN